MAASVEILSIESSCNKVTDRSSLQCIGGDQKQPKAPVKKTTINLSQMTIENNISTFTLQEAYHQFVVENKTPIPFMIRLLENPESPIALPGCVDLYGHDCLHLLLNRGITAYDEAFVIGFTMGNSDEVQPHHLATLKFFARFMYPKPYRFNPSHLRIFDLGVMYGRMVPYRGIHKIVFDEYAQYSIEALREHFGISYGELKLVWDMETRIFPR